MSRRGALPAAAFVLVAASVASAIVLVTSSGKSHLTPAAYLARADAACRVYAARLDHVAPPDLGSTRDVAASVARALPILQQQADAVRKIPPPPELEQRVGIFFERTDHSLAALASVLEAARRDDAKAMGPRLGTWFEAGDAAQSASKRVGFKC